MQEMQERAVNARPATRRHAPVQEMQEMQEMQERPCGRRTRPGCGAEPHQGNPCSPKGKPSTASL